MNPPIAILPKPLKPLNRPLTNFEKLMEKMIEENIRDHETVTMLMAITDNLDDDDEQEIKDFMTEEKDEYLIDTYLE